MSGKVILGNISREKNLQKLIIHLSMIKETTTPKVMDLLKVKERTVIRLFQTLNITGLAEISKKKRRKGISRGKPMNYWKATFEGLMLALFFHGENISFTKNFDHIAKVHNNSWLIFQEWDYLSSNETVKNYLLDKFIQKATFSISNISYASNEDTGLYIASIGLDRVTLIYKGFNSYFKGIRKSSFLDIYKRDFWKDILSNINDNVRREVTYDVMGLDDYLIGRINEDCISYYMKNSTLKKYILDQYEREEKQNKLRLQSINTFKVTYDIA